VELLISIEEIGSVDDLRSLRAALLDAEGLRGRISLVEQPAEPGRLGPELDFLRVVLTSGAAMTGLTTTIVTWLRHRRADIEVKITRDNGDSIEISAKDLPGVDPRALRRTIENLLDKTGEDHTE